LDFISIQTPVFYLDYVPAQGKYSGFFRDSLVKSAKRRQGQGLGSEIFFEDIRVFLILARWARLGGIGA
jgi:hypothetical protein